MPCDCSTIVRAAFGDYLAEQCRWSRKSWSKSKLPTWSGGWASSLYYSLEESGKRGSPQSKLEGDTDESMLDMPLPCCRRNFDILCAVKCQWLNHFQPFKSAGGSSPQSSCTTEGAGVRPYRRLPRSRSRTCNTPVRISRLMAWTRSPGTNVEADRYNCAPTPLRLKRVESWTHSCPMKSL